VEPEFDPFVCNDEVEVDEETSRILDERIKAVDEGHVVSAKEARERIQEWLSKFAAADSREAK